MDTRLNTRRVVVTGMGLVSALGLDTESLWNNLMAPRGGIGRIRAFDLAGLRTVSGAEVDNAALAAAMEAEGLRPMDRTVDMAMIAASRALREAGWPLSDGGLEAGTIFGTGAGPAHSISASYQSYAEKGPRGVRPTTVPRCMANAVCAQISMKHRLTGPNYVVGCACSSATVAIGTAFRNIRDGYLDYALCGGSEAIFDYPTFVSWNNLGVMSKCEDPQRACRPFDAERDGCVLGEGAGAFALETLECAHARGAHVLGEILGYGESSDASHITAPNHDGQVAAIHHALTDAALTPADIGYINAHGTATRANDSCECRSIAQALGEAADTIPVGSSKSFLGHLLGASGIVESIVTVLALRHGRAPANLNLDTPDPECRARLIRDEALPLTPGKAALKNSFGFGGQNSVLVFGAAPR